VPVADRLVLGHRLLQQLLRTYRVAVV